MAKAAAPETEKAGNVKEVSVSRFEFGAHQVMRTLGSKGQMEYTVLSPNEIPRIIKPNHPLTFLLFDRETPLYRPGGESRVGFKRYDFVGGELTTSTGNRVTSPQLLKLHLLNPEPLNSQKYYKVEARNKVDDRRNQRKLTASEKAVEAEVLQYLETKYKFKNERVINTWKTNILVSLEQLLANPGFIDVPVLCAYPAKSKFLTNVLEALGAQQVESITFNGQKLVTSALTGVTKSSDYISGTPKLTTGKESSKSSDIAIMVVPAGSSINVTAARAFIASEISRLEEQYKSLPEREAAHTANIGAILTRIRTEPRMKEYISLIDPTAPDAIAHKMGFHERVARMLEHI